MGVNIVLLGVVFGVFDIAAGDVCKGTWHVTAVSKCDNPQQYTTDIELSKKKINRTHDGFTAKVKLDEDFTSEYFIRLETFQKLDGGYKVTDWWEGAACTFFNQFAQDNFQDVLRLAGVGHLDCPIPKGEWEIANYVIDYASLPEDGKCGEYKWIVYFKKNNENTACMQAYSTFTENEGE